MPRALQAHVATAALIAAGCSASGCVDFPELVPSATTSSGTPTP